MVLDTTDYTVSVYYSTTLYVTGSGSISVPGINANDFFPMFMPADEIPWTYMGETSAHWQSQQWALIPRVKIVGQSITWDCSGGTWRSRNFIIMAVRFR